MSIVMSTMAKQQSSGVPAATAYKLNAICEKLKKTTSEEGDDDDGADMLMMQEDEVSDNNNSSSSSNGSNSHYHGTRHHQTVAHCHHHHEEMTCRNGGGEMNDNRTTSPTLRCRSISLQAEDSNSNSELSYSQEVDARLTERPPSLSPSVTDTELGYSGDRDAQDYSHVDGATGLDLSYGDGNPVPSNCSSSSGRRNKRKNFKPRNIVYQYEDIDNDYASEYPIASANRGRASNDDTCGDEDMEEMTTEEAFHEFESELCDSDNGGTCEEDDEPKSTCLVSRTLLPDFTRTESEQPLDLSENTCVSNKQLVIAQSNLDPGTGTSSPMDLSVRHSDDSSSCSDDEYDDSSNLGRNNGFAIDLSKGCKPGIETSEPTSSGSPDLIACSSQVYRRPSSSTSASDTGACARSPTLSPASSRSALMGHTHSTRDDGLRMSPAHAPLATPSTSTDASTMKDYAESTMKELLGLYGFNDMAESITKSVPLDNFSSGKILETMSPRLLGSAAMAAGLHSSSHLHSHPHLHVHPHQHPRPAPTIPTTQTSTQPSTSHSHNLSHHHHHHHHHHSPMSQQTTPTPSGHFPRGGAPVSSASTFDSTKAVDSMAKLASLPPNSIIGNPRVILPPNMTTTILTLAALQEQKFQAVAAAAHSSSTGSTINSPITMKLPKLEPLPTPPIATPQPSVIVSSSSPLSSLPTKEHLGKSGPIDYTRYVKRYANATECGSNYCKDLNYREHFHCMDCNSRVFVKKEEMIRHFKWHKKRDESLQHGFLRFSPMDDCSDKFLNCSHNRKQTHYHCLKDGCDKVYISTSDVQMHANYHRKDSAIIQEGFQRFRATEDCAVPSCTFYGQRTTHFHCRRSNCNYTFKNKADMEKHKTYHIKDEQLNKDGFKKFMKHEHCIFENCRFSRVCNHIHCIRAGCTYVLHSSGQLYSHKRKHERRENEMAYRKFKLAQSMLKTLTENQALAMASQFNDEGNSSESTSSIIQSSPNAVPVIQSSSTVPSTSTVPVTSHQGLAGIPLAPTTSSSNISNSSGGNHHYHHHHHHPSLNYHPLDPQSLAQLASLLSGVNPLGLPLVPPGVKPSTAEQLLTAGHFANAAGLPSAADHLAALDLTGELLKPKPDDSWKKYLTRYTANDPCKTSCEFLYKDHYHCTAENCTMMFRSKDGVREHARTHEQQEQVTEAFYTTVEPGMVSSCASDCPYQNREKHYHCVWDDCREIIHPSDKAFRRLDHYKMHDYSRKLNVGKEHLSMTLATSMDSMFKRKRGRPPKNRVIEVWPQYPMPSNPSELPQAIFTSFKLPKPSPAGLSLLPGGHVPCTTAAAHHAHHAHVAAVAVAQSLLDKHGGPPISAVATPFGLLPAAMLARPTHIMPTATPVSSPMSLSMMSHLPPSSLQPKAFSSLARLQPHVHKHTGTVSPISAAQGGADDFRDTADAEETQEEEHLSQHDEESSGTGTGTQLNLSASTDSLRSLHPSTFSNPVTSEVPRYFQQQRTPSSSGSSGFHNLILQSQSLSPKCSSNEDISVSPQQNGDNDDESEQQLSGQNTPFSASPAYDESLESEPNSPRRLSASGSNSSRKRVQSPRAEEFVSTDSKRVRVSSSSSAIASLRILKDEPVPEGYLRYRFNEDCRYPHCGYREHQTHFHCMRRDCGYSFCDKTRFVQHTARHERLDTLMGGDFQQFRANVACGRPECLYACTLAATGSAGNKASHFHCLKCDFVCTDTNKVVAHRRQHQKLDSIMAAGFEKFTPTQNCNIESCTHNQKQTHYHCMKCQYAVLGLSQMSAHKYRHLE